MIQIGIIGCGDMGRIHVESLSGLKDVRVSAFFDTDSGQTEKFVRNYGGRGYKIADELFNSDIDCVYICTRHDSHANLVNRAIEYKKAIFCEKPLAHSIKDAQNLYDRIKNAQIPFMIGFNQRFAPGILALKDYLRKSADHPTIINLSVACVNFLDAWMGKPEQGGGILPSLLCHELDLLRFIMDEEIDSLVCSADRLRLPEGYLEDGGAVICRFKSGCIANITFHDHSHPLYVFDPLKEMIRMEIHTGAKSMVTTAHDKFTVCDENGISIKQFGPFSQLYSWGYTEINKQFILALVNKTKPLPNERDAMISSLLVQAARDSVKQEKFIKFDWSCL
jgi:predicted dehydrogenase